MTRITPRTCLYPLTGSLLLTFGLSIGLTFRSDHHCYAGTCGEWLFPLQTRIHVIVWYFWISIAVTFLAVRAFSPGLRHQLSRPLTNTNLPIIGKHLVVGGALALFWVVALYGVLLGIWWQRLRDYFVTRGSTNGVDEGNERLAATALTGHLCDVTMGMALLPISRHSALASFFKLSVSTTHTFHMLTAYNLFALVLVHALLYVSWVPVFNSLAPGSQGRFTFPVLNPTYLYREAWPGNSSSLGVWRASLIFTGIVTLVIFALIFITTLPPIRKSHFNVFYFTHLLSLAAIIIICLHASTMFYCTAPGLAMWLLDWGMRLYELRDRVDCKVTGLGNGWYWFVDPPSTPYPVTWCADIAQSLSLLLPRRRLDGCACTSPLAHFYIHHSDSSMRELHPFTTITHLASQNAITPKVEDDFPIQFLFRKSGGSLPVTHEVPPTPKNSLAVALSVFRRRVKPKSEWTSKLAGLADKSEGRFYMSDGVASTRAGSPGQYSNSKLSEAQHSFTLPLVVDDHHRPTADIPLRLEGPYFTPANPARYETVVCFVAGTGVSGAIAIANAFAELEREYAVTASQPCHERETDDSQPHKPCTASISTRIWKRCIVVWSVREADYIELSCFKANPARSALEVRVHLTGKDRPRLNMADTLTSIRGTESSVSSPPTTSSTWVYLSGPPPFIAAGEAACKAEAAATGSLEWYAARWDI